MQVTVDIYEGDDRTPVLSHTAHGKTEAEALSIIETHAKYDAFLHAALGRPIEPGVYEGRFRGIPLRAVVSKE